MKAEQRPPIGWITATIGELRLPSVSQLGPEAEEFTYVDISSIDNRRKAIVEPKRLTATEAPSRARQRLREGDLLVSMTRPNLNAVALVPPFLDGAVGSTGFHVVRSAGPDPKFVFLAVQTARFVGAMSGLTQGALYPAVRPKDIDAFSLLLPPLGEQKRIIDEVEKQFTRLDAAVVALERVKASLKRYRASVLKAACEGRLVPTEAELARREGRSFESGEELLERIRVEGVGNGTPAAGSGSRRERDGATVSRDDTRGPRQVETNARRELPGGWIWTTLGAIARIQGGIQKQPSRVPRENHFPFLRVANVGRGALDLAEIHRVELFPGELLRLRLEKDDLLIVEGNGSASEIGRLARWNGSIPDCVHQNHIIRARLSPVALPGFVEAYWNSPEGASRLLSAASSTSGLYTLSVSKVCGVPVPMPPLAEQHRIVAEVERRLSVVDELEATVEKNLARCARLRQSILKMAFEGRLVPQDPNDEPASVLLERMRKEWAPEEPRRRSVRRAPRP